MGINVDKVIGKGGTAFYEKTVLRKATGKIEDVDVLLTYHIRVGEGGAFVGLERIVTSKDISNSGYDSTYFISKFSANRYFNKLKKRYNLMEE